MPLSSMLIMFPGVPEKLFTVTKFSSILRNVATDFWLLL